MRFSKLSRALAWKQRRGDGFILFLPAAAAGIAGVPAWVGLRSPEVGLPPVLGARGRPPAWAPQRTFS